MNITIKNGGNNKNIVFKIIYSLKTIVKIYFYTNE